MRYFFSINFFRSVWLFAVLIVSVISVQEVNAQQEYWIPKNPPQASYKIDARIDPVQKVIEGQETITLINNSSKVLSVVAFDWTINKFCSIEIAVNGKSLPLMAERKNPPFSAPLIYELPKPVYPRKKLKLHIKFRRNIFVGDDRKEIKLIEWFPRLWWDGLPIHDAFKVKLDLPSRYTPAVSGCLNKKTGYYENNGVRTFGVYLGKDLKTETRKVKDVLITALFTDKGSDCARLCLDTAADVVKFYRDWLGFYPFPFLYIIPGAARPMGGYPFASGIVVIHGQEQFDKAPILHWKWITAHEIGHQYWGEYMMDDDLLPWLWIGLGIYADREYTIFRNLGMGKHEGLINRYLNGIRSRDDTTVDVNPEQRRKIKIDRNNVVVHGKGFSIISALESVLGKEMFGKIYKRCLKDYGGKRLGYREFWRVCENISGQNLKWFFEQWVRSNKYLSYQVTSTKSVKKDNTFVSHVTVESLGTMRMPVPVKAVFEDGTSQVKYTSRIFKESDMVFESTAKLKEVMVDPDNKFAMLKSPLAMTAEELSDTIRYLPYTDVGKDVLTYYQKARDLKLDTNRPWFKLGMMLFDGGYLKESFEAFKTYSQFELSDFHKFTAFVWLGHLKDLLGERSEAVKYYREALKYDIGRTMRHDQYGMRINRKWVEERLKTPFKWGKKE